MGICDSKNLTPEELAEIKKEKATNKQVDMEINKSLQADELVNKLLLLGAGGSGKSTLFKQMITIYGKGFSVDKRKQFTQLVYANVILSVKTLCKNSPTWGPVQPKNESTRDWILNIPDENIVTREIADAIKILWQDPGIQATYEKRAKYQLGPEIDSSAYYFSVMDEIGKEDYVPSEQDVLRSRAPTTGIVENAFVIDRNQFKMFDVGGQRSERKKWIHCFENVTAVLFVAALSEFDQVLFEDDSTNRMTEALALFEEISNSEWFEKTAMILFLNKKDLFAEKIQKVPLKEYLPSYSGSNNYEEASTYIQELFKSKCKGDKDVYAHTTCATDTNNIFSVFNAVKDIIIKKGLYRAGLM